jgi:hypothetical protein
MNHWYKASTGNDYQGLVIEDGTGRNIAVTYEAKDAELVALAPEMAELLKRLWVAGENELDQSATHEGLNNCDLLRDVRVLLYKLAETG